MDQQSITLATKVQTALKNMDYGNSMESEGIVKEWISQHEGTVLGFFRDNCHQQMQSCSTIELSNPSTGVKIVPIYNPEDLTECIRSEDMELLSKSLQQTAWNTQSACERAKLIYKLAKTVQKNQHLISLVESISTGRHISSTGTIDTPNLIKCLYQCAGIAQSSSQDAKIGTINIVATEAPTPIFSLCWKFLPYLAMGNNLVFSVTSECILSTLLFAELSRTTGFPNGTITVLLVNQSRSTEHLIKNLNFLKILYQGCDSAGHRLIRSAALTLTPVEVSLNKRLTSVILESADLKSAIDSVLFASHSAIGTRHGCRLLVQESIYNSFVTELKLRFTSLRVGVWNDKTVDLTSCITETKSVDKLLAIIKEAKSEGYEVFTTGTTHPVFLVLGAQTASKIVQEQTKGVVIVVLPFRTVKESIAMSNAAPGCDYLSIWGERSTVALEVAKAVNATTVWINGQNNYDDPWNPQNTSEYFAGLEQPFEEDFAKNFGSSSACANSEQLLSASEGVTTYKLYYGGIPKAPEGNSSYGIHDSSGKLLACAPQANQRDVWNAVQAAVNGQKPWQSRSSHSRAAMFFSLAEKLGSLKQNYCSLLSKTCSQTPEEAEMEILATIDCLYNAAAICDKITGTVIDSSGNNFCVSLNEPYGVLAVICSKDCNLLNLVKITTSAALAGNAVIVIAQETSPILALNLSQLFISCDWPSGVINILSGNAAHLTKSLCLHHSVSAIWLVAPTPDVTLGAYCLQHSLHRSVQFVQCNSSLRKLVFRAQRSKRIHMNSGETFAN